jgi:hypothetical protein
MLSTAYRLRLESICTNIAEQKEVSITDMIWVEKLSKANQSASAMLRRARRRSNNPEMVEGSLDHFLNSLDLGDPDPTNHKNQFNGADDIADWFKRNDTDNRRD